jgi:hypothetical protein
MNGNPIEIFKPIPNYEDVYEVSNLCNVRSLPKQIQRGKYNALRNLPAKILKPTNGDVTLVKNGKKKTFDTQTLYKMAFENYKPDGKRKICILKNEERILTISRRQLCQIIKSQIEEKICKSVGVSKRNKTFVARISIRQKDIHLGCFYKESDANEFYNIACNNENLYDGNAKDFRIKLNSIILHNKK